MGKASGKQPALTTSLELPRNRFWVSDTANVFAPLMDALQAAFVQGCVLHWPDDTMRAAAPDAVEELLEELGRRTDWLKIGAQDFIRLPAITHVSAVRDEAGGCRSLALRAGYAHLEVVSSGSRQLVLQALGLA